MIQFEQRKNLIVELAGEAPENDCITIRCGVHDRIKSFVNVGFVADFHFMYRSIWVVLGEMFSEAIQTHLPNFGNCIFLKVTDHQRGHKVLFSKTGVHDEDGYTIDCRENCANDIHKEFPIVIITESEKGFGLPNEKTVPNGPQSPADMESLSDYEVIVHSDES